MEQTNYFLRSIICTFSFAGLMACNYTAKHGMMDQSEAIAMEDSKSYDNQNEKIEILPYALYDAKVYRFDNNMLKQLADLDNTLNQCHINLISLKSTTPKECSNRLIEMDTKFLELQQPYLTRSRQHNQLMRTPPVNQDHMTKKQLDLFKKYNSMTPTFHEQIYLKNWYEQICKMYAEGFPKVFAAKAEDYIEKTEDVIQEIIKSNQMAGISRRGFQNTSSQQKSYVNQTRNNRQIIRNNHPKTKSNKIIEDIVTEIYDQALVPYLSRVVDYYIRQALNSSFALEMIDLSTMKEKHTEATAHISFLAKKLYIKNYLDYVGGLVKTVGKNYQIRNICYNPLEIIGQLKVRGLKPIDDKYFALYKLVDWLFDNLDRFDNFSYFDDTNNTHSKAHKIDPKNYKGILNSLKKATLDSISMLYNILYSQAIIQVMSDIAMIAVTHNTAKTKDIYAGMTDKGAAADAIICRYKILLSGLVLDANSSVRQVGAMVRELQNIGLRTNSIESPTDLNTTGRGSQSLQLVKN